MRRHRAVTEAETKRKLRWNRAETRRNRMWALAFMAKANARPVIAWGVLEKVWLTNIIYYAILNTIYEMSLSQEPIEMS